MMKKLFLIAFASFLSVGSYAAEEAVQDKKPLGLYMGVGFGANVSSATDYKKQQPSDMPDLFPASKSDINLFVGYNIMKYLAVELELNSGLKSTKKDSKLQTLPIIGNISVVGSENLIHTYDNQSFLLNVVGKYPILEKHIPFIKFGIGSMEYENNYKTKLNVCSNPLSCNLVNGFIDGDFQGTGLAYKLAVGYEYAITQKHSVVLSFNYTMVPSVDLESELSGSISFIPLPDSPSYDVNVAKTTYSTINIAYKFTF